MRVYLVGTSGTGKTTLAKRISTNENLAHLELDSIHHQANWTPLPLEDFKTEVQRFTSQEAWVIDGNYRQVQDIILSRCSTLVILDYSRAVVMRRVIRRTLGRMLLGTTLWNGNRESWKYLFTRNPDENIVLWAWTTFERRRKEFDALQAATPSSVTVYRLNHPKQCKDLLKALYTS